MRNLDILSNRDPDAAIHWSLGYDKTTQSKQGAVITPNQRLERKVVAAIEAQRNEILAFPQNTDGLNVERVNAFRQQIGATAKPVIFIDKPLFDKTYENRYGVEAISEGVYDASIDLAMVRCNPQMEAVNGPESTESMAIHEAAHSQRLDVPKHIIHTNLDTLFRKTRSQSVPVRAGFSFGGFIARSAQHGFYLEEGYAEYERGLYVLEHDLIGQFTEGALDLPETIEFDDVPLQYYMKHKVSEGETMPRLCAPEGVFGAAILDVLIKHDNSLLTTLREARQSVAGLRGVAQQINELKPGLYSDINHARTLDDIDRLFYDVAHYFH